MITRLRMSFPAAALFAIALLAALVPAVVAGEAEVRIEKTVIPTFTLGPADPVPQIFETNDYNRAYPRSAIDISGRSKEPVDKTYDMAVLENDLLRVEVLPEVGGHVWRIRDKRTGKDVLWTNDAVKPVRVGRRRGWLAGGIEFPFPVANHGADTLEPYRFKTTENEDGSVTVTVSSFDHFYRFWGSYDITVAPDDSRVAVTVRLYNPTDVRNRYQLWINAAVRTEGNMQFIFPVRVVAGHGFGGSHPWPMMDGTTDHSYWNNVPGQLGVFGWDADFMGAYYHDEDYGIIRYSSRRLTRGIKLWTWGTESIRWTTEYSMNQGSYGEIQGGRWPTQSMYGWLEPHEMDTWTEYWYPVRGLGGVDQASPYAAMKVDVTSNESGPRLAEVKVNALKAMRGTLLVERGDERISASPVEAGAGETITANVKLGQLNDEDAVTVRIVDDYDLTLISHTLHIGELPEAEGDLPVGIAAEGDEPEWQNLVAALALELEEADRAGARAAYQNIVTRNAAFAPAWKALGILAYKQGDYAAALDALTNAAELAPEDQEALYYLGLAKLTLGREDAKATLASVEGDVRFSHMAQFVLGREALLSGDYEAAMQFFTVAGKGWSKDPVLWDHIAVAARLAGNEDAAAEAREAALHAEPLDAFAMVEELFASGSADADSIRAAIGPDNDLYIETALFYSGAGLKDEALLVAEAGADKSDSALHYYYLSDFALSAGKKDLATEYATKADSMGAAYVFPHRLDSLGMFDRVSTQIADSGYGHYHKGTLVHWLGRHDEAADLWESLVGKYDLPGLHRNVAKAYTSGKLSAVYKSAVDLYKHAIEEDPDDVELYYALDDLYEQGRDNSARRGILSQGRERFPEDDQLAIRMAIYLADRRRAGQARDILEGHTFKRAHQSWQLVRLAGQAITDTYGQLALEAVRDGRDEEALEYLGKAARARETAQEWFD